MQEGGFGIEQSVSLWRNGGVSKKEVYGGAQKAVYLYGMRAFGTLDYEEDILNKATISNLPT